MKARHLLGVVPCALALLTNCSSDQGAGSSNQAGGAAAGSSPGGASGHFGVNGGASGSSAAGANSASGAPSSGGSGGAGIEASFKTLKGVIERSCFGSGCHSESGNPLQMEVNDALYGTLTSYTTRTCGKLLDTGAPKQSALIKLLQGNCNGVQRMPYGVCVEDGDPSCILPEYIAAIEEWIARGAPRQ